jgi:molybdopterin converting factor subunit 1
MNVEVRLFATLAERAGSDAVQVEVEEGATVRDAIEAVSRKPGMREPLDRLKVVMAVNREYAHMDVVLHEGDELALIPPVSGGADLGTRASDNWFIDGLLSGRFPAPPCAELLGWTAVDLEPGRFRVAFEPREDFLNSAGVVLGGLLVAMLDDTVGPTLVSTLEPGQFCPTLEIKASFLAPARIERLVGDARVVHRGKSIAFVEGTLSGETGEPLAVATATCRIVTPSEQPSFLRDAEPDGAVEATADHVATGQADRGSEQDDAQKFHELVGSKVGPLPSTELLGTRPISVSSGEVVLGFVGRPEFLNPAGSIQGGFLTAMLDKAMGAAAVTQLEPGLVVPTLEIKTSFVRPATPGSLICRANVVRGGRSIVFTEGTLEDDHGSLVATATATARVTPLDKVARK